MRPISLLPAYVNQRLPSGPAAMSCRWPAVVTGNSVAISVPGAPGTTRPTNAAPPPSDATSQTLASGPDVRAWGVVDTGMTTPGDEFRNTTSMTPRNEPPVHRLPSGPVMIAPPGEPSRSGTMNVPDGAMLPIAGSSSSDGSRPVKYRLPSGPVTMSSSSSGPFRGAVSVENTATAPVDGAMRATAPTPGVASVAMNQRLPSGPGVICLGWGTIDGYSVTID